jgi:hypothetical protein
MARREYDGLSGDEILELFIIAMREKLSKEGRLTKSQVYHNVILRGELEIDSYPHEPKVEKFSVSAAVGATPSGKAPKKTKVAFVEEHQVPDMAREQIEQVKSDVEFTTNNESRG